MVHPVALVSKILVADNPAKVEEPVTFSTPEVMPVEEAKVKKVWPVTETFDASRPAKVELPVTLSCPVVMPVEEAKASVVCPVTNKGPETVKAVVEAFCNQVWPETVKAEVEALPSWLEINREPEAVDWTSPAVKLEMVVEPLEAMLNKEMLEEEETLNGLVVPLP